MKFPANTTPPGLLAISREMARQSDDALASIAANQPVTTLLANSIRETGKLLLLGMGASHAAGRMVEPLYRALGVDTVALALSEQLGQPLPIAERTVVVTSQSGESAEVIRWGQAHATGTATFGITLEDGSSLSKLMPCLVGAGGAETAFAATRSLTITLALHAGVLAQLGLDIDAARQFIATPPTADLDDALAALANVRSIVTSGRALQGLAEAIALGLTELSRVPAFSLEGGQLRHGPMEMLGTDVGVVMFRADDATSALVAGLAEATALAGSPTVVFDASGQADISGAVTIRLPRATGLGALFAMLPAAQQFMIGFARTRVSDVGTPLRSQKITRIE